MMGSLIISFIISGLLIGLVASVASEIRDIKEVKQVKCYDKYSNEIEGLVCKDVVHSSSESQKGQYRQAFYICFIITFVIMMSAFIGSDKNIIEVKK